MGKQFDEDGDVQGIDYRSGAGIVINYESAV